MPTSSRQTIGLLSLTAVLATAGCAGADDAPTPPPVVAPTPTADAATPEAATPIATPEARPIATPEATPEDATPVGALDRIDLLTAYQQLVAQGSFELTMSVRDLPQGLAAIPAIDERFTVLVRQTGDDRHLRFMEAGDTLAEIWLVDDTGFVDVGVRPFEVSPDDPVLGQTLALIDVHEELLMMVAAPGADYTITGEETVHGVESTVATSRHTVDDAGASALFPAGPATVDSTIWVASQGGYLTRAELEVRLDGQPDAEPATILIEVMRVGEPMEITAPIGS